MACPEEAEAVASAMDTIIQESSHPLNVIQYHITLWLSLSVGVAVIGTLVHFLTSFERDDPVLYSQLNVNTSKKSK